MKEKHVNRMIDRGRLVSGNGGRGGDSQNLVSPQFKQTKVSFSLLDALFDANQGWRLA